MGKSLTYYTQITKDTYKRQWVEIVAYKPHRWTWALLQPWALSNKLCILSEVRVGHPLVVCEETLKGQSVVNVGIHVGCQSTRSQKWLTGHVFFLTPMKRDTRLTTNVEGNQPFEMIPRLHLPVIKKSQWRYTQQATISAPQNVGVVWLTSTYLGMN